MPALKFTGIDPKKVCDISKELVDELEELLKCPRDYFTLEVVNSIFVKDGEIVSGNAVAQVSWFDRGQDIQDKSAKIITKYLHSVGYKDVDVIFTVLYEDKYYENGEHF